MGGITLKNPVINTVPTSITIAKKGIDTNGISLSTGIKANNDVVSSFIGQSLGDKAKVLSAVLSNMGYSTNIVNTARDGLSSIAKTLTEMLGIINSVGGSDTAIRTLNDIFQSKLGQIAKQTRSVEFDGTKLLTGDLGSDPAARAKYDTKPVDVRKIGIGSNSLFQGIGAQGKKVINFVNLDNIKDGDTIRLNGVVLRMVNADSLDKADESQIPIGKTLQETAGSVATAIKNHSSEALRLFDIATRVDPATGTQVMISQRSQSSANISLAVNSPAAGMADNSQPSNISFEIFTGSNGANPGAWIEIAGQRFIFTNGGVGPATPNTTYVSRTPGVFANGAAACAMNLVTAINTNPVTKALKDQGFLLASANTTGLVNIKSTLDANILGFRNSTPENVPGGLHLYLNLVSKSNVTTYGQVLKLNAPTVAGDIFRIHNYDLVLNAGINVLNGISDRINNIPTEAPPVSPAGIVKQLIIDGKLSLVADTTARTLTVYSDIDLGLQYIPVGAPPAAGVITPVAISPSDVSVIKPAIDVSGIRNIEGFIGTPSANFQIISQAVSGVGGANEAAALYQQATGQIAPGVLAVGDSVAIVSVEIAGRNFQSVVWKPNGGNLNNTQMVFREGASNDSFVVTTQNFDANFSSLSTANSTLASPLKDLFSSSQFAQTRDLIIDRSGGKIINNNGQVVGDLEGMTASLNATDFTSKQFEDFTITPNTAISGSLVLTATISGEEFRVVIAANELNEGTALKFMGTESGDSLTINIGKGGLNSLTEPENYGHIATAIKKSLMSIGSGLDVRVGFDTKDVTKVSVADLSANKLYRDKRDNYIPELTLMTKQGVTVAREVITNALNYVRSAEASLQGQGESVYRAAVSLTSATGVTKDASEGYLDTDLVEAVSKFSASLKSVMAAISTLRAGANVADAGLQIIRSAAAPAA